MTAHGIENGQEYREAPRTVSMLVGGDPAPGSPHGDRLVALMRLIAQYEATFVKDLAPRNG
jgi:antitoxin component HigA of HigAB toxin-antitoxin module